MGQVKDGMVGKKGNAGGNTLSDNKNEDDDTCVRVSRVGETWTL